MGVQVPPSAPKNLIKNKKIFNMNATEIKNEGLELHYKVVLPVANINSAVSVKLSGLAKTLKLPGFRPGKVPMKIVEQKYKSAAVNEVVQDEIESNVNNLIKLKNIKLASQAQIDDVKFEEGKDIEFKVILEKMPEIKDYDFSKIKLEKPVAKIEDKDIDERISQLAEGRANYKKSAKTSKAAKNDKVMINFEGFVDGVAFAGGKGENYGLVLGSNSFIPGFEDQLIGSKEGDKVTVKVKFPEDYRAKDLAGKDSEFKVDVLEVHKPEKVEINDELAKDLGAKDLTDLKSKMKDMLENAFKEPSFTHQKMKLFDEFEKMLDFDVPSSLASREEEGLLSQLKAHKDEDPDLKKKSEKELAEYAKRVSLRRVRIGLMLADYADKNSIKLNPEDYKAAIMNQARSFPGSEQQIIDYYQNNKKALQSLAGPILEDKSVAHILDTKVKVTVKEYSIDKFNKLMDELEK
jgi:trigger factor